MRVRSIADPDGIGVDGEDTLQATVEQALDAYARGHAAKDALAKVAPQLRQIHGALRVLSWERAALVLERCERMIAALTPQSEDLDWVAEGLSSLSLFVGPCAQGREPPEQALDFFLARMEQITQKRRCGQPLCHAEPLLEMSAMPLIIFDASCLSVSGDWI